MFTAKPGAANELVSRRILNGKHDGDGSPDFQTENTHSHLQHLLLGSTKTPPNSFETPRHLSNSSTLPSPKFAHLLTPDISSHTTDTVKRLNARPPSTHLLQSPLLPPLCTEKASWIQMCNPTHLWIQYGLLSLSPLSMSYACSSALTLFLRATVDLFNAICRYESSFIHFTLIVNLFLEVNLLRDQSNIPACNQFLLHSSYCKKE